MFPNWQQQWDSIISVLSHIPLWNTLIFVLFLVAVWFPVERRNTSKKKPRAQTDSAVGFPLIEPLKDFDWEKTEPLQLRPYKPKFHMTMALENLEPSELIQMDKTYKERIAYRRGVLKEYADMICRINGDGDNPRIRAAVSELYSFVVGMYLPTRYPQMFKTLEVENGKTSVVQNKVTREVLPTELSPSQPAISALETLCKTVDEDMLVLLPELKTQGENNDVKDTGSGDQTQKNGDEMRPNLGGTKYILEAFQTCYPAGFDSRKKLGKRLNEVHGPVPGYKEKLEKSMDRFFERLEVGKFVKRANWSIAINEELFSPFGNIHSKEGEVLQELDLDNTFLQCERQTLYRLPRSGALIFSFHTYRYPIRDIKKDGSGEALSAAIDGVMNGSVSGMPDYKRVPVWGEAMKSFLRS